MPLDPAILAANAAQLKRLEALAAHLTDAELTADLGGGWDIRVALAHLAFWDRAQVAMLAYWSKRRVAPPLPDDELTEMANEAILPLLLAAEPRQAPQLAVAAAYAIDAAVAKLDDTVIAAALAAGEPWRLNRSGHRREHLDQIERGLFGTASAVASSNFMQAYYHAYNSRREEAIASFLTEDVVVANAAGERRGRDAYLATYRDATSKFIDRMTPGHIEIRGNQALVSIADRFEATADVPSFLNRSFKRGQTFTISLQGIYTIADGRISRIEITRA